MVASFDYIFEILNIGVDEDQRVPVEAETQVCDCWAEKE
jgi:hypothetical protein